MDHLDPKQLGFVIYLVLRMHQFQKYHLLMYFNGLFFLILEALLSLSASLKTIIALTYLSNKRAASLIEVFLCTKLKNYDLPAPLFHPA